MQNLNFKFLTRNNERGIHKIRTQIEGTNIFNTKLFTDYDTKDSNLWSAKQFSTQVYSILSLPNSPIANLLTF